MPVIHFDPRTLLHLFTLVRVTQALVMLQVWRTHRGFTPVRDWAIGSVAMASGLLLIGFRDQIPGWASVLLGNALLLSGWILFDFGVLRAMGRKVPRRWGSALLATSLLFIFWFGTIRPDYLMRLLAFNLAILVIDGATVYACLRYAAGSKASTARMVAAATGMVMASSVLRLVHGFHAGAISALAPDLAQTQFFLVSITATSIVTSMLLLVTTQDLQDKVDRRAQGMLRQRERELDFATTNALTDSLTRLANRRHFDEALNREFFRLKRSGSPLSLIMLDVDYFKRFNDSLGHLAGDDCLQQMAEALRAVVERAPDLVARYGGEEFAVILPETGPMGALNLAERIRQAVEELAIPHPDSLIANHVTVSLGVVTVSPAGLGAPEAILALADEAMYGAKQGGRNRVAVAQAEAMAGSHMAGYLF
jgi:diguanylate cyclase (GGDEF)-like protein